jgi:hypothetical protein
VETVPNPIEKSQEEAESVSLAHKYITSHFSDLVQELKKKWRGYEPKQLFSIFIYLLGYPRY